MIRVLLTGAAISPQLAPTISHVPDVEWLYLSPAPLPFFHSSYAVYHTKYCFDDLGTGLDFHV